MPEHVPIKKRLWCLNFGLKGFRHSMRAVDHVANRFPERREQVRLLYLKDEHFRSICEDFLLCIHSLRLFERRPDAQIRPEVDDYQTVLGELENEIRSYLDKDTET